MTKKAAKQATKEIVPDKPSAPVTDDLLINRAEPGIAYRLELTRTMKGLRQNRFASKAGLKNSAYTQWKQGINRIGLEAANALCDTYTLTLDWIYRGDVSGLDKSDREAIIAAHNVRKRSPN